MQNQPKINLKALAGSLMAGVIVVADPDNYGPDGFPWWVNVLMFLSLTTVTYFIWYAAFDNTDEENGTSTAQPRHLIIAAIATAVLLILTIALSALMR